MASLSWVPPLALLLLLLLGLSPRGGMHVCDQPLAEASRICQGKGWLLIEHPHKHPGHHKLALQSLESEGLQGMKGVPLQIVIKKALEDNSSSLRLTAGTETADRQQMRQSSWYL